ncbi:MAG: hypothetical protein AAGL99_10620, partial [Pseudomonadota bacterium]
MARALRVAVAKIPISPEPEVNGETIKGQMHAAKAAGAHVVAFPEGALSGCVNRRPVDGLPVQYLSFDVT